MTSNGMYEIKKIWQAESEKDWKTYFQSRFGPCFRPRFSGWRSGDMPNLTLNVLKVPSSDFMKIQSDFDLLFSFLRYSRLKSGPAGRNTYPAQNLGPNISRTRIFSDIQFSLKDRKGLELTSYQRSENSLEPFLRKIGKTSIFTVFWHFFQIFWKTRIFSEKPAREFLDMNSIIHANFQENR